MTLRSEAGKGVLIEIRRALEWYLKKLDELDESQVSNFAKTILLQRSTIFIVGIGRSGLVAKAFAMRLAQLHHEVRYLTEVTVPPVREGNLFIVVSGSGTNLVNETRIAKEELGAKILVVTSKKDSPLAKLADVILIIPGRDEQDAETPYLEITIKGLPVMILGTAFEVFTFLFFEGFTGYEATEKHLSEKDMRAMHAKPQIS